MPTVFTTSKTAEDRSPISRHIDEWERLSRDDRDKRMGPDWFDQIENFYSLVDQGGPMPSFRPNVRLTDLQTIILKEANDLSDLSPQIYIVDGKAGKREKERERGLQAEWKRTKVNFHALYAQLWALYAGVCPLQFGFNPDARNGKGGTWVKVRDPRTCLWDPTTDYELNWSYLLLFDRLHIEQIRQMWPQTSKGLKPRAQQGRLRSPAVGEAGFGFAMPEGPMSLMPGLPNRGSIAGDNRLLVRHVFCLDYTRELVEDKKLPDGELTNPDMVFKFPNGRWITECEGRILADGDNPYPNKQFPIVPFFATPPLYSLWSVPALRFTMDLQNVAGRLYSGAFENAVRLNNGIWFIDERTGIDPNLFGGIPGEVQIINANSPVPQCVYPKDMPQTFLTLPQQLLDKQRELQGHGDARSGKQGAGNVSPELSEASSFRQGGITQLRARMAADSFQRLSELMFYTMGRYMNRQYLPLRGTNDFETVLWERLQRPDEYDVYLDDASIRPMSQTALQHIAPELMKSNAIPVKAGLEALNFPNAEDIAEQKERDLALQALGRVKGNKR